MSYIALFPDRVDSAILMGAVSASAAPPATHAQTAETAFVALAAASQADPACAAAFPAPLTDLFDAQAHLTPEGSRAEILAEWTSKRMYSPASARQIPRLLHKAAFGDTSFIEAGLEAPRRVFADGLYMSITCAESFPKMDFAAVREAARLTPFGDYLLRWQKRACEKWNVAPNSPPIPVSSGVPVLLVSGSLDPVTPPE